MQKEQIEARQPQPLQTRLDRLPQDAFDLVRRRLAEIALAGDAHAVGKPARKSFAHHLLGLAIAVARREVEEVDPGSDGVLYGGDAFVECCGTPQHPEAATAERQDRDRRQSAKRVQLHRLLTGCGAETTLLRSKSVAMQRRQMDDPSFIVI